MEVVSNLFTQRTRLGGKLRLHFKKKCVGVFPIYSPSLLFNLLFFL